MLRLKCRYYRCFRSLLSFICFSLLLLAHKLFWIADNINLSEHFLWQFSRERAMFSVVYFRWCATCHFDGNVYFSRWFSNLLCENEAFMDYDFVNDVEMVGDLKYKNARFGCWISECVESWWQCNESPKWQLLEFRTGWQLHSSISVGGTHARQSRTGWRSRLLWLKVIIMGAFKGDKAH